jgi:hypothetical protein
MDYLYFLGLSFRNADKALSFLKIVKINHVSKKAILKEHFSFIILDYLSQHGLYILFQGENKLIDTCSNN